MCEFEIPGEWRYIPCGLFIETGISKIRIPSTIKYIGEYAFEGSCIEQIICEKGSYAEQYAIDNGYEYCIDGKADVEWNNEEKINFEGIELCPTSYYSLENVGVYSLDDIVNDNYCHRETFLFKEEFEKIKQKIQEKYFV